jgi:hypothetical protein
VAITKAHVVVTHECMEDNSGGGGHRKCVLPRAIARAAKCIFEP